MQHYGKGAVKKSGGGPPDLSGAGSREWVSSLKCPSSTRKECPLPYEYLESKDVCVLSSNGEELSRGYIWSVYFSKTKKPSEEGKAKGINSPMQFRQQAAADLQGSGGHVKSFYKYRGEAKVNHESM